MERLSEITTTKGSDKEPGKDPKSNNVKRPNPAQDNAEAIQAEEQGTKFKDAYLIISPNPQIFAPMRGLNTQNANQTNVYYIKFGDAEKLEDRKRMYKTGNPSFYWYDIKCQEKIKNPGTVLKDSVLFKTRDRVYFYTVQGTTEWFTCPDTANWLLGFTKELDKSKELNQGQARTFQNVNDAIAWFDGKLFPPPPPPNNQLPLKNQPSPFKIIKD